VHVLVNRSCVSWIAVSFACIVALGCGSGGPSATVRGMVTYKSKPVDSGRVVLFPGSGVVVSGKLASDGSFTILNREKGEEIPLGKYKIAVVAGLEQISLQGVEPRVPLQFTSASTTPLEYEFKQGPNDITISLDNPPSVTQR
jgi:hypothetical protein